MHTFQGNNLLRALIYLCACLFLSTTFAVAADTRTTPHQPDISVQSMGDSERADEGSFRIAQSSATRSEDGKEQIDENDTEPSKPSDRWIQEIIVTAQKRAERLQDVPLSIHAITADDIERRGLVSAEDYLRGIPGVNQMSDTNDQSIVIRGIETSPQFQTFYSGPTVATYFDETPTEGAAINTSSDLKLVDIERVEVLRGPQGTAFGTSSLGGAVRTIPVAPKLDRLEGKLVAGYSATSGTGGNGRNIQAVGNLPLIRDKVALRAVAYRYEDSGFYQNRAGSDANFQAAVATRYGAEAFAVDAEVGDSRFMGGRVAALIQPTEDLKITLSYLKQKSEMDGQAVSTIGGYDQAIFQVAPEHVVRGQKNGVYDSDMAIANAKAEFDLGWASLLATYSNLENGYVRSISSTAQGQQWPHSRSLPVDIRRDSGEVRLATQLSGPWNFLAGVYADNLDDGRRFEEVWHGSPETNFRVPGLVGVFGTSFTSRKLKQKAVFGEASWNFLPAFTLTAGARAYEYDRTDRQDTAGAVYGNVSSSVTRTTDASGTSFRGNLSHKLNDNMLIYAGWAQGFRLGRAQPGLPPGLCDTNGDGIVDGTDTTLAQTTLINSDGVDNYELGGKLTWPERRLAIAAAVYRIDWSEVPVVTSLPGQTCPSLHTANVGAARSEGVEFQATVYVTEAFRVDIGGSLTRARLSADAPALNVLAGARLPGSSEVNANLSLEYEFTIAGTSAFMRIDPIYVGPFYGDLRESAALEAGDYVKVDASARVRLEQFDVSLFVRNLTNVEDFTYRGATLAAGPLWGYRMRPRTIGIQFSKDF